MKNLFALMITAAALFVAGCTQEFDDSKIWETIKELEERVKTLEVVTNALRNNIYIANVVPTSNGYTITFSDGSIANITNGIDGEDGTDGKDGIDGDTYIENIIIGENDVTFILTDGSIFSIPFEDALSIEFDTSDMLVMIPGQSREIHYTITSSIDDVSIEVIPSGGVKAFTYGNDPKNGTIAITTETISCEEKVVVLVTNGKRIIMKRFQFTEDGIDVYDNSQKVVPSDAEEVQLEFVSSVDDYEVIIPEEAQSWIKYIPETTKATHKSIVLELEENTYYSREAYIRIQSSDGGMFVVFHIVQRANKELVEKPEREALIDIFNSLNGQNWEYRYNWCTDAPLNEWDGVVTDDLTGQVVELNLHSPSLIGEIPSSIGNLTELKRLYLYTAGITKLPEELGLLKKLESLHIGNQYNSEPQIKGALPQCIYELSQLKHLEIWNHQISSFSSDISKLKDLEILRLNSNALSCTIPNSIGKLSKLRVLDLRYNKLQGSIPVELYDLKQLEELNLWYNNLSGTIHHNIGRLTNLVSLSFGMNDLTGEIPSSIGNLINLEVLALDDNKLSGNVPYLGKMKKLRVLLLELNELNGNIPPEICNLTTLQNVTFFRNKLTGVIPEEIGNLKNLEILHLNYNELSGSIPPSIGDCVKLSNVWLDHNNLTGEVPNSIYKSDWWRNSWGSVLEGNNLTLPDDVVFPGPNFAMETEPWSNEWFYIEEEYSKNKLTILFQWNASCVYVGGVNSTLVNLHNTYADKGLKIIGRTWPEQACVDKAIELGMPWKNYYSQQLNYPTYLTPTITAIDKDGMVVFSDLLEDRGNLTNFVRNYFQTHP